MNIVGPTRIILLNAGKYAYGEVELTRPLHLIGPNNVGKTSLIATLQFLYIDDQRYMHFSRDMSETRRYYFPDQNSYILFECLTPTGYQVLGVQGLGPLRQFEFRRFAYRGQFELDDFVDDQRKIRPSDEISARLASKEYRILEPKHLRAALTGIGDGQGVHLGLVPIRNQDQYERFRTVFRNLLRLAHLRQDELKRFLFDIYQGGFQQREIDLEEGYTAQFKKVQKGASELRDLRSVADEASHALKLAEERNLIRQRLPGLLKAIHEGYLAWEADFLRKEAALKGRLNELDREQRMGRERIQELQGMQSSLAEKRGALKGRLDEVAAGQEMFRDFVEDFERARLSDLGKRIEEISMMLRDASYEPVDLVRLRIAEEEHELAERQKRLSTLNRAAARRLKEILDTGQIESLFRLLNPALLGLGMGADGAEIRDEAGLRKRLMDIFSHIHAGVYSDDAVKLSLSAVPAVALKDFTDAEKIQQDIERLSSSLRRSRAALEAARNMDELKRRKAVLEEESQSCQERLYHYKRFQEFLAQSGAWQAEYDGIATKLSALAAELDGLVQRQTVLAEERRQAMDELDALTRERDRLLSRVRRLKPLALEWPGARAAEPEAQLEDMITRYEREWEDERQLSLRLIDILMAIEKRTYGRFRRETEEETLRLLRDELDALEEKEKAVAELWKGFAADLRNAFKGLARDMDALKMQVAELNRRLAGVSVSNLTRLVLIVREQEEWMARIRTISDAEEMPLFIDRDATERAFENLGDLLSRYQRVHLMDLFNLCFEVTTSGGATRRYDHLDTIESHGTTITIKVLVNLLLLRDLLKEQDVYIPFYLDEASSLDRDNLRAIVEQAQTLGFIPVLASPEAMDAADNLYFLKESAGRIVLEPKTSLVRLRREPRAPEEAAVGP